MSEIFASFRILVIKQMRITAISLSGCSLNFNTCGCSRLRNSVVTTLKRGCSFFAVFVCL